MTLWRANQNPMYGIQGYYNCFTLLGSILSHNMLSCSMMMWLENVCSICSRQDWEREPKQLELHPADAYSKQSDQISPGDGDRVNISQLEKFSSFAFRSSKTKHLSVKLRQRHDLSLLLARHAASCCCAILPPPSETKSFTQTTNPILTCMDVLKFKETLCKCRN